MATAAPTSRRRPPKITPRIAWATTHDYDKGRPPKDYEYETHQTAAFEKALPNARVVRLPYASHYVFRSNETEVVGEMNAFMETLH